VIARFDRQWGEVVDPKYTAGLVPAPAERLTPTAVRTILFRWARLGHRGFDADDVREFCRRVEDELIMLLKERVALQDEVGRLRRQALGAQADPTGADFGDAGYGRAGYGAAGYGGGCYGGAGYSGAGYSGGGYSGGGYSGGGYSGADGQARTVRILAQAQQTAERYIGDAQEYCRRLAQDARRQRDETLAAAHVDAALVREEAHEQASRTRRAAIAAQHPAQRQTSAAVNLAQR
jgi:hypothetical protein